MPLILFEGGPLNGYVYETATLLQEDQPVPYTEQYKWTSERRRSETTDAVAQVWRHASLYEIGDDNVSDAVPPTAPTSLTPARTAAVNEMRDAIDDASAQPPAATPRREPGDVASVPEFAPAGPPTEAPTVPTGSETDLAARGASLTARRKALKWSRDVAKEKTGLATSRIWALDTGKTTKNDAADYATYDAALTAAEGGSGAGGRE